MNKKILVVDDEPSICLLIEYNLKLAGYEVQCVHDGESALAAIRQFRPDLVVLDLMLPKMDGIQVCSKLREQHDMVPIIMLTALQDLSDKIAGLDNGADDYMTKPFSPHELISRIQAVLRRVNRLPSESEKAPIRIGNMVVQPSQREVTVEGKRVDLTPKEFELLLFLCKHQGKVLSRRQLLHGVWEHQFMGDTRIVDVHISHLRDKIEKNARSPQYIVTIRNVGYKLTEPAQKESLA